MRTLVIVLAVLVMATVACAQDTFVWFFGVGNGDFMDSPPTFVGSMDAGGDITAGSWTITIPDAGWPTDPVLRAQYIWDTFYAANYTAGTPGYWKGYFDTNHGLPEMNALAIVDDTNGGTMTGVCTIEIQVDDANNDGVLDAGEFCAGSMTGIVIIIRNGEGVYDGMCGTGNFFGTYSKNCPSTLETWNYGMYLYLDDCSTPVESTTWGVIKSLYQ